MAKIKLPNPLVLVYIIMLFVALLTWFIPPSVATTDASGDRQIIFNASFDEDGSVIENAGTKPVGLWDVIMAPIHGFSEASTVSCAILVCGAFLGIMNYTGALDAGIGVLLNEFKGSTLIAILMFIFALMGTVYGVAEELPAYAIVVVPLFVAAGYDVITGVAVVLIGAAVGNMASVVNPYSTGAAIAAIGNENLSLGSGLMMRLLIFVVLYVIATFLILRYANKVKSNREVSVVSNIPDIKVPMFENEKKMPEMTTRRKWSLIVFCLMIFATILGYIPWYAFTLGNGQTLSDVVNYPIMMLKNVPFIGNFFGLSHFTLLGDWYFNEFTFVFLAGSIILGFINRLSESEFVREFVKGSIELINLPLVLSVAMGISIIMGTKTEGISLTLVYWIQNLLGGIPAWTFVVAITLTYLLIGFFMQSTSGVSGITMPILGAVAVALFANSTVGEIGGQLMLVSSFTMGINFTSSIYPGATVLGILLLYNIPYAIYLKFSLKIIIPALIAGMFIVSIAPYLGLL